MNFVHTTARAVYTCSQSCIYSTNSSPANSAYVTKMTRHGTARQGKTRKDKTRDMETSSLTQPQFNFETFQCNLKNCVTRSTPAVIHELSPLVSMCIQNASALSLMSAFPFSNALKFIEPIVISAYQMKLYNCHRRSSTLVPITHSI